MIERANIQNILARNGVFELSTESIEIRDRRRAAIAEEIIGEIPVIDYEGLRLAILDILEAKLGKGNGEFNEIATEIIEWIKDSSIALDGGASLIERETMKDCALREDDGRAEIR
jgi:hypothetical protein